MRLVAATLATMLTTHVVACTNRRPARPETKVEWSAPRVEKTVVGPIVVREQHNVVLRNMRVTNPYGDCIEIDGATNIVIEFVEIGPCTGRGVSLHNSRDIKVRSSTLRPAYKPDACCDRGTALLARAIDGLVITGSVLQDAETLVELYDTSNVLIEGNVLRDPWGPFPRGQMIQVQRGSSGVIIRRNHMTCNPGRGCRQEDAVNIYNGHDITIVDNQIVGPISENGSGCGILVDGYGAQNIVIRRNLLFGQTDGRRGGCGIGVAGGEDVLVESNRVSGYGNIAFYVWAQPADTSCRAITLRNNVAGFGEPRSGQHWFNPYWDGGGCGIPVVSNNNWQK